LPTLIPAPTPSTNTILEIGFGAGEHLMHVARAYPDRIIIGAEPYVNGVAKLLSQISDLGFRISDLIEIGKIIKPEFKNIRIWNGDVRELLNPKSEILNQKSQHVNFIFDKIYVLHPDPWPKARHEKRRLLQAEFIRELYEHLAPGGEIIIGTDHMDLLEWITEQIRISHLAFCISDTPPSAGMNTRYKTKDMFGAKTTKYIIIKKE